MEAPQAPTLLLTWYVTRGKYDVSSRFDAARVSVACLRPLIFIARVCRVVNWMYEARLQYEFATRHLACCIPKTQLDLNGAASGQLAQTAYSLCTQTESETRLSVIVCLGASIRNSKNIVHYTTLQPIK